MSKEWNHRYFFIYPSLAVCQIVIYIHTPNINMTPKTEYVLPMARLCPTDPNAKIIDCFMSNYELEQTLDNIVKFTGLDKNVINNGIELLLKDKLIKKTENGYITNFKTARLIGLYSYYRATLKSNLDRMSANQQ